jgi:phosphatidate phosphatase PAH1
VVTDIDETLTVSDEAFLEFVLDPTLDIEMRPDANATMQAWTDAGHTVIYLTARGAQTELSDERTVFEATDDWLDDHGFPRTPGDLRLAPEGPVFGEDALAHKTLTLEGLQAGGAELVAAYGNADSDLAAYEAVGLTPEQIWVVGELAGDPRGQPIPDDEAFAAHRAALDVPTACQP